MPKDHTLPPHGHTAAAAVTPAVTNTSFVPEWTAENVPYHPDYQDIYYNKNNGLEESEYVFATQNRLPERFAAAKQNFMITELGFGTGLNLFLINDLWRRCAQKSAHLTYITFERDPLSKETIKNALNPWYKTEKSEFFAAFLATYDPKPGWNTYQFDRLTVHLAVGDITEFLPQIKPQILKKDKQNQQVDAWLLDGFAPARNPKMWSELVFKTMAETTKTGGTFATFTAAAVVRNGLIEVGFLVEKTKGYGHKRQMLTGAFHGQ